MPVLTFDGISDWGFTVSDDVPAYWLLYFASSVGGPYSQIDSNPYGTDSNTMPPGGGLYWYGVRSDDGVNPRGPISNIIVN